MDSIALQRFQAKYTVLPSGCWMWSGAVSRGYGQMQFEGRLQQAHRLMYEHHHGPIPDGLTLDHRCHTDSVDCGGGKSCLHRRCVNPDHLEPVTQRENNARSSGLSAQNTAKTHCPTGHPYSGENLYLDKSGRRHCRECSRAATRRHYQKHDGAALARERKQRRAGVPT